MIKTDKLQYLLRDAVSQLSTEHRKATAGLVPGYRGVQFHISEDQQKIAGFPEGINSETSSDIFNIGVRQICRQMIESASMLSDEMLVVACQTIVEELQASEGEHLFIFFVPSIILTVDERIEIGSAILRKATVADAELLEGKANAFVGRQGGNQGPLDKSDFLKRYLGSSLVELRFYGCHLKDELSVPGDAAVKEFRRVAAFLMACKELLQIPEAYTNRGPDFDAWPHDAFMVGKRGDTPLISIYSHKSKFSISGLEFAIDAQVLEQLEKFCHLRAFNQLCQSQGELRDKIYRSLDWFLKGCVEEDPTDRLVCFFISLESLMAIGSDALNSQTDDLAENIALLIHRKVSERIEEKNYFKKKVYPLRNRVMHHGHTFEAADAPISERLMVYITHGLIGILKHSDAITKDGGPRKFFERIKMGDVI